MRDDIGGDFERNAFSLGFGYNNQDLVRGRARLEYRTEEGEGLSQDRETWALPGDYRHVGNNAKIGLGYEWGRVSDNMIDLDYVGDGLFLNLIAKF